MPWIRRDFSEIRKLEKTVSRRNLIEAFIAVPIAGALVSALLYFVPNQYSGITWPLYAAVAVGVFFSVGFLVHFFAKRGYRDPLDRLICIECHRHIDPKDAPSLCKCGGVYELLSAWKWIEPSALVHAPPRPPELDSDMSAFTSGGSVKHCPSNDCPTFVLRRRHPDFIGSESNCDVCGAHLVIGHAPKNLETDLLCPNCRSQMVLIRRSGVLIDRCDQCSSIWFDSFELDRVLRTERKIREFCALYDIPFEPDNSFPALPCPRCRSDELLNGKIGDVFVHRCRSCMGLFVEESLIESYRLQGITVLNREVGREVGSAAAASDVDQSILESLTRLFSRE